MRFNTKANQKKEKGSKTGLPNTHPLPTKGYKRQPKFNIILQEKQCSKLPEFEILYTSLHSLILFPTEEDFRNSNMLYTTSLSLLGCLSPVFRSLNHDNCLSPPHSHLPCSKTKIYPICLMHFWGICLALQWLRLHACNARGTGLVTGWGGNIFF